MSFVIFLVIELYDAGHFFLYNSSLNIFFYLGNPATQSPYFPIVPEDSSTARPSVPEQPAAQPPIVTDTVPTNRPVSFFAQPGRLHSTCFVWVFFFSSKHISRTPIPTFPPFPCFRFLSP